VPMSVWDIARTFPVGIARSILLELASAYEHTQRRSGGVPMCFVDRHNIGMVWEGTCVGDFRPTKGLLGCP
jgi:hypothetical protein